MNALKLVGRVLIVLVMIPAALQLVVATLSIVAAAKYKPEALSYALGHFTGTLLCIGFLIWLFKKLGTKSANVP
jgi:hypothetical protein